MDIDEMQVAVRQLGVAIPDIESALTDRVDKVPPSSHSSAVLLWMPLRYIHRGICIVRSAAPVSVYLIIHELVLSAFLSAGSSWTRSMSWGWTSA
jgi:hypothetical protein